MPVDDVRDDARCWREDIFSGLGLQFGLHLNVDADFRFCWMLVVCSASAEFFFDLVDGALAGYLLISDATSPHCCAGLELGLEDMCSRLMTLIMSFPEHFLC